MTPLCTARASDAQRKEGNTGFRHALTTRFNRSAFRKAGFSSEKYTEAAFACDVSFMAHEWLSALALYLALQLPIGMLMGDFCVAGGDRS